MKALGKRGGAASSYSAPGTKVAREGLERQLSDLATCLRDLNGSWACVYAGVTPNSAGDIFNAVCMSSAHVLPSDMETMDKANHRLPIPLYNLRICGATDHTLEVFVLGQPISVGAMEALFAHTMVAFPIGEEDRDSVAASAAGRPRWGDLLSKHGVHQPVLAIMQALCEKDVEFAPCSGIPITAEVNDCIARREGSWMGTNKFYDRTFKHVQARPESFPVHDVADVTCLRCYDDVEEEVFRTAACSGLVQVPALTSADVGLTCTTCKEWRRHTLSAAVKKDYKSAAAVSQGHHMLPDSKLLVVNPWIVLDRKQSLAAELQRTRVALRMEREKLRGGRVKFTDGSTAPISAVFCAADEALKEGALKNDARAAELFGKGSMFRTVWDAQVRGAKVSAKEQAKLDERQRDVPEEKKATGRGMRYSPLMMRWALKLYGQGHSAYKT
jgi:hypothetical protein